MSVVKQITGKIVEDGKEATTVLFDTVTIEPVSHRRSSRDGDTITDAVQLTFSASNFTSTSYPMVVTREVLQQICKQSGV